MQVFWSALYQLIDVVITLYSYIVIGRAIISWVNPDPYNPIVRFLHNATDPVLDRMRRFLPLQFSGIDLTPIVLLLGLFMINGVLLQIIAELSRSF